MKKQYLMIILLGILLSSCSLFELDNYDEPKETLKGTVMDKFTNEPMQTGTGSMRIKLEEMSWSDSPTPQYFGTKQDGTYHNSRIFSGDYRVTLENGPFVPLPATNIKIQGTVVQDFYVQPYLHLEMTNVAVNADNAVVSFKITTKVPVQYQYKILDARVYVNTTEFVDSGASIQNCNSSVIDLSTTDNVLVYGNEYMTVVKNLPAGRNYFIRAAARVDDPISKSYNYSAMQKITIQ